MKPILETITPEIATSLLKNNHSNRPLNTIHVAYIAKEMSDGRWKTNGDMIRISSSSVVVDGQHRLEGIIRSGVSVETWVMYNVPDDVFETIDLGKKRSFSDTLSVFGEKNATRLASALILVAKYYEGVVEASGSKFKNSDLARLLNEYPDIREAIMPSYKGRNLVPPTIIDAVNLIFRRISKEDAAQFISQLAIGENLTANDPAYVLRSRLYSNKIAKTKLNRAQILALIVLAWNHFRAGRKIVVLKLVEREGKLINFPVAK